jgi:hypothetical protein
MKETGKLFGEDAVSKEGCELCMEADFDVGQHTNYGIIVFKIGDEKNGWFATLSPKTGGTKQDFTIQLMPFMHLTHFSQIETYRGAAENYGSAFSKISRAMTSIMMEDENLKAISESKELSAPIATYGKSTTWKEKKEHLHIKIFPFRGNVGQPYTVDSSFGRKEVFKENDEEFVKLKPVSKVVIDEKRLNDLSNRIIGLLEK